MYRNEETLSDFTCTNYSIQEKTIVPVEYFDNHG